MVQIRAISVSPSEVGKSEYECWLVQYASEESVLRSSKSLDELAEHRYERLRERVAEDKFRSDDEDL